SGSAGTVADISPTLTTPVISGTAQEGQTLTATAAVANDSDATVAYQWQQNIAGTWTNISGASSLSYIVTEANEGNALRIVATSSDGDGSGTSANSAATGAVQDSLDLSASLTGLTGGNAVQGTAMSVTSITDGGAAVGSGVTYQWQINSGSGFVNISGATNSSYTPSGSDEDKRLQVVVTYADAAGNESTTLSAGTVQASQDHWKSG